MRHIKRLAPFILLFATIFIISACGSTLEKPTGLENTENEQLQDEVVVEESDNAEVEVKEDTDTRKNEDEKSSDLNTDDKKTDAASTEKSKNKNKTTNKPEKDSSAKEKGSSKNKSTSNDNSKSKQTDNTSKSKEKPKKNKEKIENNQKKTEKKDKKMVVQSVVISKDEVPLPPTEIEIKDGDTVLDALIAADQKHTLHLDFRGGQGSRAYVQGIDNVYEFDRGQGSGWMFRVNGVFPNRGAGVIPLKDGDRIEWLYTMNLGEDLGADLKPFR